MENIELYCESMRCLKHIIEATVTLLNEEANAIKSRAATSKESFVLGSFGLFEIRRRAPKRKMLPISDRGYSDSFLIKKPKLMHDTALMITRSLNNARSPIYQPVKLNKFKICIIVSNIESIISKHSPKKWLTRKALIDLQILMQISLIFRVNYLEILSLIRAIFFNRINKINCRSKYSIKPILTSDETKLAFSHNQIKDYIICALKASLLNSQRTFGFSFLGEFSISNFRLSQDQIQVLQDSIITLNGNNEINEESSEIDFTHECEVAMNETKLDEYEEKLKLKLNQANVNEKEDQQEENLLLTASQIFTKKIVESFFQSEESFQDLLITSGMYFSTQPFLPSTQQFSVNVVENCNSIQIGKNQHDSNDKAAKNDLSSNLGESDVQISKLADDHAKVQDENTKAEKPSQEASITKQKEMQKFLDFIPQYGDSRVALLFDQMVEQRLLIAKKALGCLNEIDSISQLESFSKIQEKASTQSENLTLKNQAANKLPKRRQFMRLGLSKLQKLKNHLHSNFS
jgi:hypothetical protein